MDSEKLIEKITRGESISDSKELFGYVNESEENTAEYIRQKNLWALLQTGKEMDQRLVSEGLHKVRKGINRSDNKFVVPAFVRYAAIVILALIGGYLINGVEINQEVAMNEVVVPRGNRSSVVLPDGTKVWLSNGTKLVYPETFNGKTRDVKLEGEGFFQVTHDEDHPFIVNIGKDRIKVLGTEFAVVAYPDDEKITAELVSGKIQFDIGKKDNSGYKSYLLKPTHSLVYDKTTGKMVESIIPDGFYDYWQKGAYKFRDESFESLAKKIERIYNVEIVFENEELKERQFTGTLNIDDNIYTIMEVFQSASGKPFDYEQDRGRITIKFAN